MRLCVALSLLVVALCLRECSGALSDVVNTQYGPIRGVFHQQSRAFLGVPFAKPPVGALRWAPPQPPTPWGSNILNTQNFSAGCPQDCVLPPHTCPTVQSEDCLYFNIYTPLVYPSSPALLPVMVFFPGGRFEQGTAGTVLYAGDIVANLSSVIMITSNYRLGALGLLRTSDPDSGNFAIQDQRMVLKWIQTNIANFGGDPNLVTLFGQSAGAMSTAAHIVSPLSQGLFQRVIIESDPLTLPMYDVSQAQYLASRFSYGVGCGGDINAPGTLACMRSATIPDILAAQKYAQNNLDIFTPLLSFVPWTPVVDPNSSELPIDPFYAIVSGNVSTRVPMMIGTVWNEALVFIFMAWNQTLTGLEYDAVLADVFLDEAFNVDSNYPVNTTTDYRPALALLGTDYIFACSNRAFARAYAGLSGNPSIYRYVFHHVMSFDPWGPRYPECVNYTCHGAELPFVFDSADEGGWYAFDADEKNLSRDIIGWWTNFAYTGNPSKGPWTQGVFWPEYSGDTDEVMQLMTPQSAPLAGYRKTQCDFWDWMGYGWGF